MSSEIGNFRCCFSMAKFSAATHGARIKELIGKLSQGAS